MGGPGLSEMPMKPSDVARLANLTGVDKWHPEPRACSTPWPKCYEALKANATRAELPRVAEWKASWQPQGDHKIVPWLRDATSGSTHGQSWPAAASNGTVEGALGIVQYMWTSSAMSAATHPANWSSCHLLVHLGWSRQTAGVFLYFAIT